MWLNEGLLISIAKFLDFKGLSRLCFASKQCEQFLRTEFTAKAHPNAMNFIAQQIMTRRRHQPSNPFTNMLVRNPSFIVFTNYNEDGVGEISTFWVRVDEGVIRITASYAFDEEQGFTTILGRTEATIALDRTRPMRRGRVTTDTASFDYTNGLDPRLALDWCPLVMPDDGTF